MECTSARPVSPFHEVKVFCYVQDAAAGWGEQCGKGCKEMCDGFEGARSAPASVNAIHCGRVLV